MQRITHSMLSTAALVLSLGALAACGGDDDDDDKSTLDGGNLMDGSTRDGGDAGADAATPATPKEFALHALIQDPEGWNGYVAFVPSVENAGASIDTANTAKFPGFSDTWVIGSATYVASGDGPRITRHERDATGKLTPDPKDAPAVDFTNEGVKSVAFWNNIFISPTKAYMANGPSEIVVWNPTTMQIEPTKKITVSEIADIGALKATASFADRSNILHDGKLYRVIYWTEDSAKHAPSSLVVVIDTATDAVVKKITVPCGALDYGTKTDDGQLFFSNWTYGAGGAAVGADQPPSCFAQIDPKTDTVVGTPIKFADVTGGYEAAAMRYIGGTKFGLSRLDIKKGDPSLVGKTVAEVVSGPNFTFYTYDAVSHEFAPVAGIEPNSGAVYEARVKGQQWALIPGQNQTKTVGYRLVNGVATKGFEMKGWVLRLFGFPN